MEIFLLLLLGSLMAGVGVWAGSGDKSKEEISQDDRSLPLRPDIISEESSSDASSSEYKVSERIRKMLDQSKGVTKSKSQTQPQKRDPLLERIKKGSQEKLKVRNTTDKIIPRSSRFAHHRRSLLTAEALAEKQKADESLELYERTSGRISDKEITDKINENIDDIRRWQEGFGKADELKSYPDVLTPANEQAQAIENLTEALKRISEGLAGQLAKAFEGMQHSLPAYPSSSSSSSSSQQPSQIALPQMLPATPATGESVPANFAAGANFVLVDNDTFEDDLPPGITLNEQGELVTDGWTDDDFEREWDKFKNLPVEDRRGGQERRADEGGRDPRRPFIRDRRASLDRRTTDLFQERDQFLAKLERHKAAKEIWEKFRKQKKRKQGKLLGRSRESFIESEIPIQLSDVKIYEEEMAEASHLSPVVPATAAVEASRLSPVVPATAEASRLSPVVPATEETPSFAKPSHASFDKPINLSGVTITEEDAIKASSVKADKTPSGDSETTPSASSFTSRESFDKIGFPSAIPSDEPQQPQLPSMLSMASAGGALSSVGSSTQEIGFGSDSPEELQDFPEIAPLGEGGEKKPPVVAQEIHGVLELKPPEEDDAPFLTLTYDFAKIPDSFKLSSNYHTMEYAYYKYKPMLVKAQEFTRRKMLKNALNYYRVIKSQNIPPEFKRMVNRNIQDITEYLEKFLMNRSG